MHWKLSDGYTKISRLVDDKGRIVAEVRGSTYDDYGWQSFLINPDSLKKLGIFVSEETAKAAAETAFSYETQKENNDE